jgi:RiboL-PSP-HEPN
MPISGEYVRARLVAEQVERISQNLTRVESLVKVYEKMRGSGGGRRPVHSLDILRAGVVLLHASLEDFLRSLATVFLPIADEQVLDSIPLVGTGQTGHPEKFFLGKLAAHRGKTVDDVITESVRQYLEYSNYNNASDIAGLLRKIGVDASGVKDMFADIERIIKRRHQIVHRADRVQAKGSGHHYAQSINPEQVRASSEVIRDFMRTILGEVEDN